MYTTWKTRTALGLAAAVLTTIGWSGVAQAAPSPNPPAAATATADAALIKNLTFMRQEEQLARDVYTALASKYSQAAPFVNIATSEQRHFDTLGLLLARYGIADPAAGHGAGSYADAELQALAVDYGFRIADTGVFMQTVKPTGLAVEERITQVVDPPSYEVMAEMIDVVTQEMAQ